MEGSSMVRQQMIQFLLFSSAQLGVRPIVKYTALSLYAERFYPSLNNLKSLGDEIIGEQHFTIRDFLESEVVFMQVLDFEIGVSNIAFLFLEDLLIQFRELARVGELVNFETCMNIMDLLYETEETSSLYASPCSLAASILVASYVITVPKQQWEFPLLPWVKFVTSYKEESIEKLVRTILEHVLKDHLLEKKSVLEEKV
ncbi:PREDICTED: cyclin-J18-like isoform X3 [Nelumbo nucifera]|uniref:Cyclin-J18-like isoform X3 n=1 Tax=Nelumbo nucifera TaxID=4432 RepID=A0A1U8AWV6_NELNU|nr:PREDICTED: cyclin-J18-like isoform X3 [Nelumbo nucifera]